MRPTRAQPARLQDEVPLAADVDLSAMSFDERLEYLAAQSGTMPPVGQLPEEDEGTLFGIDADNAETQWWQPAFWRLCFEDLSQMQWPTRQQTIQTVVTSQVAFAVILVLILSLDAVAESSMRSLLQGKDFSVTLDMVLKQSMEAKSGR